jgi:hypothetical protein
MAIEVERHAFLYKDASEDTVAILQATVANRHRIAPAAVHAHV